MSPQQLAIVHRVLRGGGSIGMLATSTGVRRQTASEWVRELQSQGLVRIDRWGKDALGRPVAMYRFGRGADAERPGGMTPAEKQRAYRARVKRQRAEVKP
jgi:transposase-like protein